MQTYASEQDIVQLLYSNHHHWLRKWLTVRLGCAEQADDFTQDTFLRILLSTSQLSSLREPRAYLKTVASRLVIDDSRRKRVEKAWIEAWTHFNEEDAYACSAEVVAEVSEILILIVKILEGLPEKVQKAFLWNRLDGCTYAEIATRLNVSPSSVKQYIARAMLHCHDSVNES